MALLDWQTMPGIVAAMAFLDADFFVSIAEDMAAWMLATGRRTVLWFAIVGPVVYLAARWFTSRIRSGSEADATALGITQEDADSWAASLPASEPTNRE